MLATPACIMHLDVDAFFASVEQRDDPRLRGRPVAVGTGVVASCSYEARRWGVATGMRLTDARQRCRPLLVLAGDYRRYEQAARHVLAICSDRTPRVEVTALDDMYLDLTQPNVEPTPLAAELQGRVDHEVGLSVSLGIGTNKLIAAVATEDAKKRKARSGEGEAPPHSRSAVRVPRSTAVWVPPGQERGYLAPWPADVLPGVGPRVRDRLERLNVARVGDMAAMPLPVMCGLFGRQQGKVLRDRSWGIDPRPVQPARQQQSVSRRTSFDPPSGDRGFLQAMLNHLLERAASWLRFQGLAARGLSLFLRYGDYEGADGRVPLRPATADEQILKEAAADRFGRLYSRRLPLRLLGIELAPLITPCHQPGLFPDPAIERAERLTACKDAVRERFGFMSLMNGTSLIAAGRVEHDRENFRLRTPCLTR